MAFTLKTALSRADATSTANAHPLYSIEDWMIVYQTPIGVTPIEHGIIFSSNPGAGPVEITAAAYSEHLIDGVLATAGENLLLRAGTDTKVTITKAQLTSALGTDLSNKVDSEVGKGLSDTNFTQAEKTKLSTVESPLYKGVFATLLALQTAHPLPTEGSTARVSPAVVGDPILVYNFSGTTWVLEVGATTAETNESVRDKLVANANVNIVTDAELLAIQTIGNKVDKVTGKVLSDQNFTLAEKQQLQAFPTGSFNTPNSLVRLGGDGLIPEALLPAGTGAFIDTLAELEEHLEALAITLPLPVAHKTAVFNADSMTIVDRNLSIRVDANLEVIRFQYNSHNGYPTEVEMEQNYYVLSHDEKNYVSLIERVTNGTSKGRIFGSNWIGDNYELDGNNHFEGKVLLESIETGDIKVYSFVGRRRQSVSGRLADNKGYEFSVTFTITGNTLSTTGVNL